MSESVAHLITVTDLSVGNLSTIIYNLLPSGGFGKIFLKPNWVKHEEHSAFPIGALVTSSSVVRATLDACLQKYPTAEEITIADVPLQGCNWRMLIEQSGIRSLADAYRRYRRPIIRFLDLRREYAEGSGGYVRQIPSPSGGDPKGYREIMLDEESFLDPVSSETSNFRVSDYSPTRTTSSHRRGFHRYLVAASALDCDLFLNLPKVKTHQKSGITGALKNLVGINGEKGYLVHYRQKKSGRQGDEFPPDVSPLILFQTRLRDALQGQSRTLFSLLGAAWQLLRKSRGIETIATRERLHDQDTRFFIAPGAWYGNDTIWRMVYDLNLIVRYAGRNGNRLCSKPQREYFAIADGIVAGEGNGPLQPLPVSLGRLLASPDPFLVDMVMARIMGFAHEQIPLLANVQQFNRGEWGKFDPERTTIIADGKRIIGIGSVPVVHEFMPPPGWKGHIENVLEHKL